MTPSIWSATRSAPRAVRSKLSSTSVGTDGHDPLHAADRLRRCRLLLVHDQWWCGRDRGCGRPQSPPARRARCDHPGVGVEYYALANPSVLPTSTLDSYASDDFPSINFPSTNGNFATSGRNDDVGAVFISSSARRRHVRSSRSPDDGSRLYIGDEMIGTTMVSMRCRSVPARSLSHPASTPSVEFFERGPALSSAQAEYLQACHRAVSLVAGGRLPRRCDRGRLGGPRRPEPRSGQLRTVDRRW